MLAILKNLPNSHLLHIKLVFNGWKTFSAKYFNVYISIYKITGKWIQTWKGLLYKTVYKETYSTQFQRGLWKNTLLQVYDTI